MGKRDCGFLELILTILALEGGSILIYDIFILLIFSLYVQGLYETLQIFPVMETNTGQLMTEADSNKALQLESFGVEYAGVSSWIYSKFWSWHKS